MKHEMACEWFRSVEPYNWLTWLMSCGMTNLRKCSQARQHQQDSQPEENNSVQSNPHSVHCDEYFVGTEQNKTKRQSLSPYKNCSFHGPLRLARTATQKRKLLPRGVWKVATGRNVQLVQRHGKLFWLLSYCDCPSVRYTWYEVDASHETFQFTTEWKQCTKKSYRIYRNITLLHSNFCTFIKNVFAMLTKYLILFTTRRKFQQIQEYPSFLFQSWTVQPM